MRRILTLVILVSLVLLLAAPALVAIQRAPKQADQPATQPNPQQAAQPAQQIAPQPAQQPAQLSERRVALVIGNGAYKHAPPLPNPANDARLMAEALRAIGFELVGGRALTDVGTKAELDQAVRRFGEMIRGGGVGVFFYAGHGVQVDGKNYLIPVNADVGSRAQIKYELVDADYVLDEMNESSTKVNLVILDACRNNPFAGRGLRAVSPGLATVLAPKGTLIAYSTAPGKTAADGTGKNSPFSESLARQLRTPGQRIEDVFINVGVEVEQATGGAQSPWQSNSLRGIFCLSGTCGQASAVATPAAKPLDLKAEKQRVAEEAARLKGEQEELAQFQALQAEKARLEAERQKVAQAKQLALAPVPKQGPQQAPGAAPKGAAGQCRVVAYAPEQAVLTGRLAVTGTMRDGKKLQALLLNLDEPVVDANGRFGGKQECGKAVELFSSDASLQTRLSGLLRNQKNVTITVSGTLTEHHDPGRHFLPVIMDVKAITEVKAGAGDLPATGAQQAPASNQPPQAAAKMDEGQKSLGLFRPDPPNAPKPGALWKDPATGMEFVWVPGGCFKMGSPSSEDGRDDSEGPAHEVCVSGLWVGKYAVTNAQYRKFKPKHDSRDFKGFSLNGDRQPAVNLSWNDATVYAQWLSGQGSGRFRLPTEAEWEYAARAGTTTSWFWGDNPKDACKYANLEDKTTERLLWSAIFPPDCDDGYGVTAPVGSFRPNAFGLYDMLGNAWQWCEDVYDKNAYGAHPRENPVSTGGGADRVCRGGSWRGALYRARASARNPRLPEYSNDDIGLRLVREP